LIFFRQDFLLLRIVRQLPALYTAEILRRASFTFDRAAADDVLPAGVAPTTPS
jgi:hypothetical protein